MSMSNFDLSVDGASLKMSLEESAVLDQETITEVNGLPETVTENIKEDVSCKANQTKLDSYQQDDDQTYAEDTTDMREETQETVIEKNDLSKTILEHIKEDTYCEADQIKSNLSQQDDDQKYAEDAVEKCKEIANVEENSDKVLLERIAGLYEMLSKQVSDLELLFNKRIMHTDHEDKVIDQMHAELQRYKEDLYAQLVRPILLDVIEACDSIMKISAAYLKKPEGESAIPNEVFVSYAHQLQDILKKNNVEIYRSKSGELFVPVKQRVIKKEITHDENVHGKISESFSCGYSYGGKVISAEKVSVYFYENVGGSKNESEGGLNV